MPRPLRILVAEDDPNDVAILKRAFARSGRAVSATFVRDGQEIINYLKKKPPFHEVHQSPTLLLLDLKLPGLNGLQVLKWLRRQGQFKELLVVIFTASENPDDMRKAYELGADSFLIKPKEPEEMAELLRDMEERWLRIHATPECGSLRESV
jgi:CheY-like chemotaxis protein